MLPKGLFMKKGCLSILLLLSILSEQANVWAKELLYGNTITLLNKNVESYLVADNVYHIDNQARELVVGHKTKSNAWKILPPYGAGKDFKKGEVVKTGDIIQLQHVPTGKYLYSQYDALSPRRNQQEISLIPEKQISTKTNWLIVGALGATTISDDNNIIKLIHTKTNAPLHAGNLQLNRNKTTSNDQGFMHASAYFPNKRDNNNFWQMSILASSNLSKSKKAKK